MKNYPLAQRGFTLIEIMVVVVILGILAALVVPKIASRPEEARMVKAKQDILAIENALDLYKLDNGNYPTTDQGIEALTKKPNINPVPLRWQQYLKTTPLDPWGRPYLYLNPGVHGEIDIFSYGPSGRPDSEQATIGNWANEQQNNA